MNDETLDKSCVTCGRPFSRDVVCADCRAGFVLKSSEIEFYRKRGLNLPRRCPECRAARKAKDE